jgi:hypothetical protein
MGSATLFLKIVLCNTNPIYTKNMLIIVSMDKNKWKDKYDMWKYYREDRNLIEKYLIDNNYIDKLDRIVYIEKIEAFNYIDLTK